MGTTEQLIIIISLVGLGLTTGIALWRVFVQYKRLYNTLQSTAIVENAEAISLALKDLGLIVKETRLEFRVGLDRINGTVREHSQTLATLIERVDHKQDKQP
jgi:hypothetical protein